MGEPAAGRWAAREEVPMPQGRKEDSAAAAAVAAAGLAEAAPGGKTATMERLVRPEITGPSELQAVPAG